MNSEVKIKSEERSATARAVLRLHAPSAPGRLQPRSMHAVVFVQDDAAPRLPPCCKAQPHRSPPRFPSLPGRRGWPNPRRRGPSSSRTPVVITVTAMRILSRGLFTNHQQQGNKRGAKKKKGEATTPQSPLVAKTLVAGGQSSH